MSDGATLERVQFADLRVGDRVHWGANNYPEVVALVDGVCVVIRVDYGRTTRSYYTSTDREWWRVTERILSLPAVRR